MLQNPRLSPRAFGLCAIVLLSAGCREDVSFAPPPQQEPHPWVARVVLDMTPGQPAPWGASILSGVDPPDPKLNWRWLTTVSQFGFRLEDRPDWQLDLHLTAVDYVLKQLGPQSLTVIVDGAEVGKLTLEKPGPFAAHLPVKAGGAAKVELRIEPCDPRPDRSPYCALLHSIGFSRELR
jgi:hypothetical protein